MKKLLVGSLSALFVANASATLISLEHYQAELTYREGGETTSIVNSSELYQSSIEIVSNGRYRTSLTSGENVGETGEVVQNVESRYTVYGIESASFGHTYSETMASVNSLYQANEVNEAGFTFGEFIVQYDSTTTTDRGKLPPYGFTDSESVQLGLMGETGNYWKKSEAEGISGQYLTSSYSISLWGLDTEAGYEGYDSYDELIIALEGAMLAGVELVVSQTVSLYSFQNESSDIDNFDLFSTPGTSVHREASFLYNGKARITAIGNVEVPEPSAHWLLAMGLMGLVRLKRFI